MVAAYMVAERNSAVRKAVECKVAEQAEHNSAEVAEHIAAEHIVAVGLAERKAAEPAEPEEPVGYFRPFSLHLQKQYK
ncbi:hypothetical protein [Gardnerella sp. 2492-Sm]|uniref:hypothetical protein n=1 Tax=unclassified Gardnerella TaxID=2628112 RepID=UPI003D025FA0